VNVLKRILIEIKLRLIIQTNYNRYYESLIVTADMLRFYHNKPEYGFEPGECKVFIGGNSGDVKEAPRIRRLLLS
jgi:hypothetical protein